MSENAVFERETVGETETKPTKPIRASDGKFVKGCPPGPGRAAGRKDNLRAVRKVCTPERVEEVLLAVYERAKDGDGVAAKTFLAYACGLPRPMPSDAPELGPILDAGDAFSVVARLRDMVVDGTISPAEARALAEITRDLERRARRLVSGAEG